MRAELDGRFAATVAAAPRVRDRPEAWPPFGLPPALRASLAAAARLDACSAAAVAYYTERMPALLVDQLFGGDDPARALLWRPLDIGHLPKTAEALSGLFAALAAEDLDGNALVGAADPASLLVARPTTAALYAHTLFGTGLPLLGAYPIERALLARELMAGDPDAVLDLRLGGNLVHELCHGPSRDVEEAAPWMIVEAAAIHLGAAARRQHVFPDEPGEAVPGTSLFVCVGSALARRFGRRALWRVVVEGAPLEALFGARAAAALETAAWQDWLARQEPPFARDALAAMSWVKLIDATAADDGPLAEAIARAPEGPRSAPSLLEAAARTPWRALPSWQAPPVDADRALVAEAVGALFQVNRFDGTFQTHPSEPPGARLWLDVEACTLAAEPRPDGVFAEPAWWWFPPSLARRLAERGARRVRVEGARRAARSAIAAALWALALDGGRLPEELVLPEAVWTSLA